MKLHKLFFVSLCIILGFHDVGTLEVTEWINNFLKYLQNYNKPYETLIIIDKGHKSPNVEDMVQTILKRIPSLQITFQNVESRQEDLTKLLKNTCITMVIIVHLSKVHVEAKLSRIFDFIAQLSGTDTRPRCLIILPQEDSFSYRKLLQNLWYKRFLDATILELLETKRKKSNFLNMSLNPKSPIASHQYNPFTNTFCSLNYSKSISWFPDKLLNLQGFRMKVGLVHVPPFVYLEHNSKGDLLKESGMDVVLTKELSKVMNFRMIWNAPEDEDAWGSSIACTKENSTGLLSKLMTNELDFLGFENGRYGACVESLYGHSKGTKLARVSIVVPILRNKSDFVLTQWEIFKSLALVSMFLLSWFISYMLLRRPRSLNFFQIASIVLGTTAPNEPQKLSERLVFGSMLVSCLLHGPFIYSTLTEVSLQIDTIHELETIEDVLSSNLLPIIGKDYHRQFYEFTEGDTRLFLEKSNVDLGTTKCLKMLLNGKNVACVARSEVANSMMEENKDSCGRPVMKILNDVLRSTVSGMNMEAGSPYVKRFDEIIQRFIESGLVEKWQRFNGSSVVLNTDESCAERGSETTQLKRQIFFLFVFGYAFATAAFCGEIIFSYFLNSRKRINKYAIGWSGLNR